MSRPVAILGGGGHSRVVLDVLRSMSRDVLGIIDLSENLIPPPGVRLLGTNLAIVRPDDCELALGVGSVDVGVRNLRLRLFLEGKAAGFSFITLRHPSSVIARDVELGEGTQIMAGSVIQPGTVLGRNVLVNSSASIDHDCRIADHVHIAPGVVLCGGVTVGKGVHLGTGAVVIQGLVIAEGAMIGAGAVVTEAVAAGARVRPRH